MADRFKIDLGLLPEDVARLEAGLSRLPADHTSPLVAWDRGYTFRSIREKPPRVSQSGKWRGNRWPKYKSRRTKGGKLRVPWGGQKKLRGSGVTLGSKRPSGARLAKTSTQLQDTGGMWQDAFGGAPLLTRGNTRLERFASKKYAARQHKRRPFMFGKQIEREELAHLEAEALKYIDRLLG